MVSPAPAAPYAKVKRFLKEQLARGRWSPGELMPSEAELVGRFHVSRMTVTRALRELRDEGLVERVQGVGTFAARLGRVASTLTIRDLHAEIAARGHRHHAEVHVAREESAPAALASKLGLAAGDRVFHTVIVHHENGVPLQCEDRYVSPECAPRYLEVDFTRTTPTHYLLEVAPIWRADYAIEACPASLDEARLLAIEPGDACLVIVRRTASRERPITIGRLVHPGSRYTIEGAFAP